MQQELNTFVVVAAVVVEIPKSVRSVSTISFNFVCVNVLGNLSGSKIILCYTNLIVQAVYCAAMPTC